MPKKKKGFDAKKYIAEKNAMDPQLAQPRYAGKSVNVDEAENGFVINVHGDGGHKRHVAKSKKEMKALMQKHLKV